MPDGARLVRSEADPECERAPYRYVSPKQIRRDAPEVATYCANRIRRATDSQRPNAAEMHRAAVLLTVHLCQALSEQDTSGSRLDLYGEGGYIAAEELAAFAPLIFVDARASDTRRARILAHEFATHLQRTRVAPELYNAETVLCLPLDGRQIRHAIAQDVEAILYDDRADSSACEEMDQTCGRGDTEEPFVFYDGPHAE